MCLKVNMCLITSIYGMFKVKYFDEVTYPWKYFTLNFIFIINVIFSVKLFPNYRTSLYYELLFLASW